MGRERRFGACRLNVGFWRDPAARHPPTDPPLPPPHPDLCQVRPKRPLGMRIHTLLARVCTAIEPSADAVSARFFRWRLPSVECLRPQPSAVCASSPPD